MKAAVLYETDTPLVVEDVELEEPRAHEVLVRIGATGVCHSDWHVINGATKHPLPAVLGHEGAGVVEAVGEGVSSVKVGDHVILNWAPNCGSCFYCMRDKPNLCDTFVGPIWAGTMLDGTTRLKKGTQRIYHFSGIATFAEQTVVPEPSCVPIDKNIPMNVAALVGCAVTTGVGAVLKTYPVHPGDQVAVYGCGGVGLNIVQAARLAGARAIIAVDRVPAKAELAKKFGATEALVADERTEKTILEHTEGRGADVVYEAIGVPAVQEAALEAVRPGGALVLVGLAPMGSATNFSSALLTRQEKQVLGSYYGTANTRRDFGFFLELYRAGKLNLDDLVSREYALEDINEAYQALLGGEVARGVIGFR